MAATEVRPARGWITSLIVTALCTALALTARPPYVDDPALARALAQRFRFTVLTLPERPAGPRVRHEINPSAHQLRYYLHQVGGSAALGDLDGDGLANDLCWTDARSKTLNVGPVPGTGDRFAAFEADLGEDYDPGLQMPTLCRIADVNEDGLQDLLVGFMNRTPRLLLRRDGEGGPAPLGAGAFKVQRLQAEEDLWTTSTATFADLDGDGHKDLLVGNYMADGTELGDPGSTRPIQMNDSFSNARNGGKNRLYLFQEAGGGAEPWARYADAGDVFPEDTEDQWTLAVGAADLDRDGLDDLYVANDFGPDTMLLNRSTRGEVRLERLDGERTLSTPTSQRLGHDTFKGMGIDFADLNGDGIYDLYVSNIGRGFALRESHFVWMSTGERPGQRPGVAPWVDQGNALGVGMSSWGWESRMEDFDADGVMELVQATGLVRARPGGARQGGVRRWTDIQQLGLVNDELVHDGRVWPEIGEDADIEGHHREPFFVRGDDGRYVDISGELYPEVGTNARGIATGDVDGDGDIDMVFAGQWDDTLFLRNEAPRPGSFLGLHLLLPLEGGALTVHEGHPLLREGTPAVGAMAEIQLDSGRTAFRQVDGGNGHAGARAPDLIFGLGEVDPSAPVRLSLRWRERSGAERTAELALPPGWHTVVLGSSGPGVEP